MTKKKISTIGLKHSFGLFKKTNPNYNGPIMQIRKRWHIHGKDIYANKEGKVTQECLDAPYKRKWHDLTFLLNDMRFVYPIVYPIRFFRRVIYSIRFIIAGIAIGVIIGYFFIHLYK